MRKQVLIFITIILCMVLCVSCSEKSSEYTNKDNTDNLYEKDSTYDTTETNNTDKKEIETDLTKVENSDKKASGEMNQYMAAISEYFQNKDNRSHQFSDWIIISAPIIYYIDKSYEKDIKVFGNFWHSHYTIYENRLREQDGGEAIGICHIKKENDSYSMFSFDEADGGALLKESIENFENQIDIPQEITMSEWYSRDIQTVAYNNVKNVVLYKYAIKNGLDCSAYVDHFQNITINIPKIKKVKYNNDVYTDTGQILYNMTDDKGNFQIEKVTDDINNCLENNASDFEKCTIKTDLGDNQIGVMIDGRWHVFEK